MQCNAMQCNALQCIEGKEDSPVLVAPEVHDICLEMRIQGLQVLESEFVEGNALLLCKFHSSA